MASDVKATYLTASGVVFAGRTRVKAIHYQAGASPTLLLNNSSDATATNLLTMTFVNSTDDSVYIPDEGMLFADGCFAVLTNVDSVTVFYN